MNIPSAGIGEAGGGEIVLARRQTTHEDKVVGKKKRGGGKMLNAVPVLKWGLEEKRQNTKDTGANKRRSAENPRAKLARKLG